MERPKVLLAKKPLDPNSPRREETLLGHTEAVMGAAQCFGDLLASHLVSITRCSQEDAEHWRRALSVAAWLHDLGKANSHFQEKLGTRDTSFRQGVRHEGVSLVIAGLELRDWLEGVWSGLPKWARCGALFAVSGHHLKFPDDGERPGTHFTAFLAHRDFRELLQREADTFNLDPIPDLKNKDYSLLTLGEGNGRPAFCGLLKNVRRELDYDFSEVEKVLIAALKAALIDADLAGSALPRHGFDARGWLQGRLGTCLTEKQLQDVVDRKLEGRRPRAFQKEVLEAGEQTVLLEAGCGSGKTAAAYLWASRKAKDKRLFFCYPTTGTASEGFAGYLSDPDFDAILIHSRADVDYDLLDAFPARSEEAVALRDRGLEALETWPIPAVVCTTHTVLGLMENYRRGLYAFPSILRSAFVFDEIHALTDKVFGYLCRFLQAFPGAPVLLMTATLPPARMQALEKCCQPRGEITRIHGPRVREQAKRYRLSVGEVEKAWVLTDEALKQGRKVLWICNTVGRAMEMLDEALRRGHPAEPFHSRYRYKDRLRRQRAVIDGFRHNGGGFLAVTTQVAEISLDISAHLLISDAAPIPSMIQRLGRLNRVDDEPKDVAPAIFLMPESRLPYEEEEWRGADQWLEIACDGNPESQHNLAEMFVRIALQYPFDLHTQSVSGWLDGLWKTTCDRSIEEASRTIEVVREEDVGSGRLVENAIPMNFPKRQEWLSWRREGRYFIAPRGTIIYDEIRGAKWTTE